MLDIGRLLHTLLWQGYDEVRYQWKKNIELHEFRCVKGDRTVPFAITDVEVNHIKREKEAHVRAQICSEIKKAFERE